VMFSPDQEAAAAELMRVCRPRGRIGLTNWTPDSFLVRALSVIGRYVLPVHAPAPELWGTRQRLLELFNETVSAVAVERRQVTFRYRSPIHWIDALRTHYGPVNQAFASLEPDQQKSCTVDLLELTERANVSGDRTLVLPTEYLQVIIERTR
jgi:hypothetical protein